MIMPPSQRCGHLWVTYLFMVNEVLVQSKCLCLKEKKDGLYVILAFLLRIYINIKYNIIPNTSRLYCLIDNESHTTIFYVLECLISYTQFCE